MSTFHLGSILLTILHSVILVDGGAIQLTSSNIDSILASHEIVFVNFYANWCRFSQMLDPIFNEFADKVAREHPQTGLIAVGKVDCDSEGSLAARYHVNKYPTLKLYRYGQMAKKEYRGARQVDAFYEFVRKHLDSAIIKMSSPSDLFQLDSKKRYVIGHFESDQSENYKTFSKVANFLRDECLFAASTNKDEFKNERPTDDVVYYRPPKALEERESYYMGSVSEEESLKTWSKDKCVALVREITFQNAEELTDEGLPFLILFHRADDHQSVGIFEREVAKQLMNERTGINCLHADGAQFIHPLQHLGKSLTDLPVVAIDSFRHMFLFPDFNEISKEGKLLQFVKDLHSEKLHRDFHNPPASTTPSPGQKSDDGSTKSDGVHLPKTSSLSNKELSSDNSNKFLKSSGEPSSPPESVFVRLSPNRQRYSFRDEL